MRRFAVVAMVLIWCPSWAAAQQIKPNDALPPLPKGKAWKLVWHDEFDGPKLDESKWLHEEGRRRDGWWTRKAISFDREGHLVIETKKEDGKYLDACISTRGKYEHRFGFYVARIRLHKQEGHWPGFWITGPGVGTFQNGGRDGTEIDIMEKPTLDDVVEHNLHWGGYEEHHQKVGTTVNVPGVMNGFHTFALWWKSDEYVFYIDGKETWRTKAGGVCQVPQYILLSDEVGPWVGDIRKAKLPDRLLVDYVRVYDVEEQKDKKP
jgi:beta-glucanase (GH16 family)